MSEFNSELGHADEGDGDFVWQQPDNNHDDFQEINNLSPLVPKDNESNDEPENKESDSTFVSEVTPTPFPETSTRRRKLTPAVSSSSLTWGDVVSIFEFSEKYESLNSNDSELFCHLFDIPINSSITDIAQALNSVSYDHAAFSVVIDIVNMSSSGETIGFGDGIRLVTKIDALPDLTIKGISRQISAITNIEIKYRKNIQLNEFVVSILDALDKTRNSSRIDKLKEFQTLLDVWPGAKK